MENVKINTFGQNYYILQMFIKHGLSFQTSKKRAAETTDLTKSFGWDSSEGWFCFCILLYINLLVLMTVHENQGSYAKKCFQLF